MKQYSRISYVKEKAVVEAFDSVALKYYVFSWLKEVFEHQSALLNFC